MPRNFLPSSTLATALSRVTLLSENFNGSVRDVDFLHLMCTSAMVFPWCRGIALAPVGMSLGFPRRNRPLRWTGNRNGKRSESRYCADAARACRQGGGAP